MLIVLTTGTGLACAMFYWIVLCLNCTLHSHSQNYIVLVDSTDEGMEVYPFNKITVGELASTSSDLRYSMLYNNFDLPLG